ncbi:hypothetical protein M513_04991 [Trichuris suis]|uniref:Uncharacterized protein n=1 Tax=Trichuris suis TaxID=68888 RepID=A0A085MAG8_9BILA|nr:hypothetical protein M513_04991 [Trichuris suis]
MCPTGGIFEIQWGANGQAGAWGALLSPYCYGIEKERSKQNEQQLSVDVVDYDDRPVGATVARLTPDQKHILVPIATLNPLYSSIELKEGNKAFTQARWRNGSASDPRSEGWVFKSLTGHRDCLERFFIMFNNL